jgi:hypothetical protein
MFLLRMRTKNDKRMFCADKCIKLGFFPLHYKRSRVHAITETIYSFFGIQIFMKNKIIMRSVAPQILIVLFLIYLFDNIIQLISLRSLWYYGGW